MGIDPQPRDVSASRRPGPALSHRPHRVGYQPSDVERLILAQPEAATEPTDEAEPTDDDPTDDDPTDDADSTDEWATAQPAED